MKHSSSSFKPGFTLIEIMLALMVITIGVVSITGLLSSSLSTSSKAHDDITVVTFADMILNSCHANGFESLSASSSLRIDQPDGSQSSFNTDVIETYTGATTGFDGQTHEYTISYRLTIQDKVDAKQISLEIWPNRNTDAAPRRFYTEIYNWNRNG